MTTQTDTGRAPLWRLAPVGLAELTERAALQTRIDRKYVLPVDDVDAILTEAGADTRVLEIDNARSFAYQSVYFDTPELTSYLLAARKRRRRFKIRTRTYLDSSLCWLEVKTRGCRGATVKHRLPYEAGDNTITAGRSFVDSILDQESITGCERAVFTPVLVTRYRRSTLLLPATNSRVTIDLDLEWSEDGEQEPLRLPGLAIVETKTGSVPSQFDRLLWARGHRPIRISKYATGLAALHPYLPSARWQRALGRYFSRACQPVDQLAFVD